MPRRRVSLRSLHPKAHPTLHPAPHPKLMVVVASGERRPDRDRAPWAMLEVPP